MRIDKFLKVSRLIKRRTIANEACDGKVVKASYTVKTGDIIEIGFGNKSVKVKVEELLQSTKKDEAKEMFSYL